MITRIMHQHTRIGHIIGMIVLDLEVIDFNGSFQQLMLGLFWNAIYILCKLY